jgi:broad specificity phosphatase PhoE
MVRLYLVRHGRAASGFGEATNPGLDDLGRSQAGDVAARLAPLGPLALRTSPLKRTQETAKPLAEMWGRVPEIDPAVAEIPSPNMNLAERSEWLRGFMGGSWRKAGPALAVWREALLVNLCAIQTDTVIFSHFVAINVAAGAALNDDRVVVFKPDNCSVSVFDVTGNGLSLVEKGHELETTHVN